MTKKIQVKFVGVASDTRLGILKISTMEGDIVFQKLQEANENFSIAVKIPNYVDHLIISFAGIEKTFNTKSGTIIMKI